MARYVEGSDFPALPADPAARARELVDGLLTRTTGARPAEIRESLQDEMHDKAFVIRTEIGLKEMERKIAELKDAYATCVVGDKGRLFNTDLTETIELGFLLDCAEATVAAALARQESRGGHYREDFPQRDDGTWLKHSLAFSGDGSNGVRLDYKPVCITRFEPKERVY